MNKMNELIKSLESRVYELKYLISTMKTRIITLNEHISQLKDKEPYIYDVNYHPEIEVEEDEQDNTG